MLEAQHDTDFVTGDEVDGGTDLTSKSLCAWRSSARAMCETCCAAHISLAAAASIQ